MEQRLGADFTKDRQKLKEMKVSCDQFLNDSAETDVIKALAAIGKLASEVYQVNNRNSDCIRKRHYKDHKTKDRIKEIYPIFINFEALQ
jgi:hypothetical protein